MIEPLAVDAALATLGLDAVLHAKPPKFGVGKQDEAAQLPNDIRKMCNEFLSGERRKCASLPPFKWDAVRDLLDQDAAEAQMHALTEAVPIPELALDVAAAATRILKALTEKMPRRMRETLLGPEALRPSDAAAARFARAWSVACDPLIVLRDLCEGSLSRDMVECFQEFYPALYEATQAIMVDCATRMKARRASFAIEGRNDRLYRILMGIEPDGTGLGQDYQALFKGEVAQEQQESPPPGELSRMSFRPEAQGTPGQKAG